MKLSTYLKKKNQAEFAREIGVHPSLVTHWLKKRRRITAEMAKHIEEKTKCQVLREEIRPDIFGKVA